MFDGWPKDWPKPLSPQHRDMISRAAQRGKALIDKHGLTGEDIGALIAWAAIGMTTNGPVAYRGIGDPLAAADLTFKGHALAQDAIMMTVGYDERAYGEVASYFTAVNLLILSPFVMRLPGNKGREVTR